MYNSIAGMHREPLQAPPTYWFYGLMMIVTFLADFAGYRLIRPMLATLSSSVVPRCREHAEAVEGPGAATRRF